MRCASWHVGDVKAARWLPLIAGKRSGAAQVTALRAQVLALSKTEQGAGRLIRDETDRGVLMICDPRLISKPYGKRIWQSLPSFKRTRDLDEVRTFFASTAAGTAEVE